jgi:hypothetical protein
MTPVVYITTGLRETLLRLAREADPDEVAVPVAVSRADEIQGADLPADTPVFTHFYMPEAGHSVRAVFGVDLGTPPHSTQGLFVSHPHGPLRVTREDDLKEVVFVAVTPWDEDTFAAFDRRGVELSLEVLDAEPAEEFLE